MDTIQITAGSRRRVLSKRERFELNQAQHPNPRVKMYSVAEISRAATLWYGSAFIDNCCLAENRLMSGEPLKAKLEWN